MNYLTLKRLKLIAVIIWVFVLISMLTRELSVVSTITNFSKSFSQINNFFDTAESRMKFDWQAVGEADRAFEARFKKQSQDFHRYVKEAHQRNLKAMGYEILEDGNIRYKEEKKPAKKAFSEIQKEFEQGIVAGCIPKK